MVLQNIREKKNMMRKSHFRPRRHKNNRNLPKIELSENESSEEESLNSHNEEEDKHSMQNVTYVYKK